MTRRAEGKVAFITGAARGQGRSHAVRQAEEGADIIAIDICRNVDDALPMATPADLAETVKLVEAQDRRIIASQADVRDLDAVQAAVDDGVAQLGRLDIVVANAGIASFGGPVESLAHGNWDNTIDINLTGPWHTARAAIPHLVAGGRGGSIVLTSSAGGNKALPNMSHYIAAKHGVVGLMRSLAVELGVLTDTFAASAICATVTCSKPRSSKSRSAACRIARRVSARLRSRSGSEASSCSTAMCPHYKK